MEVTGAAMAAATPFDLSLPLAEGRDYYFELGRFVLTAAYLLRRGSCCDNGCRHCPYRATPPDDCSLGLRPGVERRSMPVRQAAPGLKSRGLMGERIDESK